MTKIKQQLFSLIDISVSINNLNKRTEKDLGLSLVQWCVLTRLIDMPAASAFSLAEAVGVQPSTLSETLPRLERKGYIFITEDPRDSRKKMISITRDGSQTLATANGRLNQWLRGIDGMAYDFQHVRDYLKALSRNESLVEGRTP